MTAAVDVVRTFIQLFAQGRTDEAVKLYHPDVLLTSEFHLPHRVERRGRDTIAAAIAAGRAANGGAKSRMYHDIRIEDLQIHEMREEGLVVAEWLYVSKIGEDEVENRNIIVVKVVDGLIVMSRDYHNDATRAQANGKLSGLLGVIEQMILPKDR